MIFAACAAYSGVSLLARVYPALFPGQTLASTIGVTRVVAPIPGLGLVNRLKEDTSFNDRINLLIIGVDKRPQYNEFGGYLTDVVMVATLDPIGKRVNVLSFPRDMLINIHYGPGPFDKYEDRINTSYGTGFREGNSYEAGARQLERDLKENFGIEIDNWVLLDFTGVEQLIDAIEGIDVDIPPELSVGEWFYSDDDIHGVWLAFPPGRQHLDGYRAVAFGRHREYDSDLVRVKRQQLVMTTALQKLFSLGLLNNPVELWHAYSSMVKTDMSKARMVGLVPLVRQTQGRTSTFSVGDPVDGRATVFGVTTEAGAAVLEWDPENVQYWLNQTFPKVKYAGSSVEIQDAYGDDGGARASALARYFMFYRSLPTVYLGPDLEPRSETTITLFGDRESLAVDVAKWLSVPMDRVHREPRQPDSTLPDILIVVGRDFRIPGQ